MNIAFIGSGNVAWHLAPALENAGHKVVCVSSRNFNNAKQLTQRLYEAEPITSLDFSSIDVELLVISVRDDAIEEVAKELVLPDDAVVVHTSGSKSVNTLGYVPTERVGVFYPLQTFSKKKRVDFSTVPLLVESEDSNARKVLLSLAKQLSKTVKVVTYQDRQALHVSAVFACNLTNHLMTIARDLLLEKGLDFEMLKPLITETVNKSLAIGPHNSQTGPAVREDFETLENHIQYLSDHPEYSEIYKLITQNIIDTYIN